MEKLSPQGPAFFLQTLPGSELKSPLQDSPGQYPLTGGSISPRDGRTLYWSFEGWQLHYTHVRINCNITAPYEVCCFCFTALDCL